jgi:hypothetical protein
MLASFSIPLLALYFQPQMYKYHVTGPESGNMEFFFISLLCVVVEALYLKVIFTSPGFLPRARDETRNRGKLENTHDLGSNWCKKCETEKPVRAHHCSTCNRCVLRMDHHCPFTNCCIGLLNERWFIFWLIGILLGCVYGVRISWGPFRTCLVRGMMNGVDSLDPAELARCAAMGKASFIFFPALGLLLFSAVLVCWHLFLIATNYTTIEFFRYRLGPILGGGARGGPLPECCGTGTPLHNLWNVLLSSHAHAGPGQQ